MHKISASAYDPRVMLKIVLLAYSQGLISSQVIALSGDSQGFALSDVRRQGGGLHCVPTEQTMSQRPTQAQ